MDPSKHTSIGCSDKHFLSWTPSREGSGLLRGEKNPAVAWTRAEGAKKQHFASRNLMNFYFSLAKVSCACWLSREWLSQAGETLDVPHPSLLPSFTVECSAPEGENLEQKVREGTSILSSGSFICLSAFLLIKMSSHISSPAITGISGIPH